MPRPAPLTDASPARPDALPALTGVRALAAAWVVALHLTVVIGVLFPGPAGDAFLVLARPGALGVDVFYVLSGFIISWNYHDVFARDTRARDVLRFLRARLARLYPVHLAILLALVVAIRGLHLDLHGAIPDERWSTRGLIESLLLVHAWVGDSAVWNSVSWSISAEWFAYLLFPLGARVAAALYPRLSRPQLLLGACGLATIPLAHALLARILPIPPVLPLLQIAAEFGAGCVTCHCLVGGGVPKRLPAPGLLLATIVAGAAALHAVALPPVLVVPLVPPMLLGLATGRDRLARWLSTPGLLYWGRASYALYMTHYLWLWVMRYALPAERFAGSALTVRLAMAAAHVVPMLGVASATYAFLEEPARRALQRRQSR